MQGEHTARSIAPADGKLGVLLVGLGAVSTTFIAGVENVKRGSAKPIGSLTQLARIRPGQPAEVYLPAYSGVRFEGSVQGIGWGVEQQEGDGARGPSGVPSVTPTVDWVRMAQRFPVRITIADNDPTHQLRKGMRATVRIDTTVESGGR